MYKFLMFRSVLSTQIKRGFATSAGGGRAKWYVGAVAAGGAAGYYMLLQKSSVDYQKVYNDIAGILEKEDYDDGSYGPVLLRLAWHASGTYDKKDGSGGSDGATMRFAPESDHGANAGLTIARNLLLKVKKDNPNLSFSDLWSLAGVVAIQEMVLLILICREALIFRGDQGDPINKQ